MKMLSLFTTITVRSYCQPRRRSRYAEKWKSRGMIKTYSISIPQLS